MKVLEMKVIVRACRNGTLIPITTTTTTTIIITTSTSSSFLGRLGLPLARKSLRGWRVVTTRTKLSFVRLIKFSSNHHATDTAVPGTADPVTTDHVNADPVTADPVTVVPIAAVPVTADPVTADPVAAPVAGGPAAGVVLRYWFFLVSAFSATLHRWISPLDWFYL
ncbi:pleckstrin homology domain-containing family a member 5-like isoform x9 [Plakobranchus ocellatus]|uniref:Pleckstrin homology domain-containing family a member 5-like isoform x9 n=1 Tax=Plakobranchus ocellatus TaxID=259542 RepID=A0AAV4BWT3_9GAST|nr:pleckstrin homology domain-containing family a member 5-like isoform x9 [Plakobranchus ocellatus]